MCQVSSSYSLSLPCHLLACCISSCHHVHCIIMFSKPASVRVSPVPSIVRSEPNHTRTRPRHVRNIILLVAEKCSRNGLEVGMLSCFSVDRPPVKFHRLRSSFDSPTVKYSGNSSRSNVGRFRSPETVAGLHSSPLISAQPLFTTHLQPT